LSANSTPKARTQGLSPGTVLRHYKGGLYTVVGTCLIEATLKQGVLYKPHQGDSQDVVWMRPLTEFNDMITTENGTFQRFTVMPQLIGGQLGG